MENEEQQVVVVGHGDSAESADIGILALTQQEYQNIEALKAELAPLKRVDSDLTCWWSSPRINVVQTAAALSDGQKVYLSNCLENRLNSFEDSDYCGINPEKYLNSLINCGLGADQVSTQHIQKVELSILCFPESDSSIHHRVTCLIDYINQTQSKRTTFNVSSYIVELPKLIILVTHPLVLDILAQQYNAELEGSRIKFIKLRSVVDSGSCKLIAAQQNPNRPGEELLILTKAQLDGMITRTVMQHEEHYRQLVNQIERRHKEEIKGRDAKYQELAVIAAEAQQTIVRAREAIARQQAQHQVSQVISQPQPENSAHQAAQPQISDLVPVKSAEDNYPMDILGCELHQGSFVLQVVKRLDRPLTAFIYCFEEGKYSPPCENITQKRLDLPIQDFNLLSRESTSLILVDSEGGHLSKQYDFKLRPDINIEFDSRDDGAYDVCVTNTLPEAISGYLWCPEVQKHFSEIFDVRAGAAYRGVVRVPDSELLASKYILHLMFCSNEGQVLKEQAFDLSSSS
jgi:hypothetical protein